MVKYWYCLHDVNYYGHHNIHVTTSFKAACANLRKIMVEEGAGYGGDAGCIFESDPRKLPPRYEYGGGFPPSLSAIMDMRPSKTRSVNIKIAFTNYPPVKKPANEYVLYKRKPRTAMRYWPEYIVHYDGSLTAVKK